MGLLGALIVFAPRPLYPVHLASTTAWGLTPLADQQLAGLLMWVPAMLPYVGVGLWLAWSSLRLERASAVTIFLKFVHLAAIAIWSGGLIVVALPVLAAPDARRRGWISTGCTASTRFVYVELTSPAAFVAIGSGTALIFLQATFQEWFSREDGAGRRSWRCCTSSPASSWAQLFLPEGRFGLAFLFGPDQRVYPC